MATINEMGTITARCPGCKGALATYLWRFGGSETAAFVQNVSSSRHGRWVNAHRMYKCAGCNRCALASVTFPESPGFPAGARLEWFYRETAELLSLPAETPKDLVAEFREAEDCLSNGCYRAAAGLFRSVLDKTLRANGYKLKPGTTLEQQIDLAASDGVITKARQRRVHEEVRVLGNDVLHDDWEELKAEDVEPAHQYVQRVLEDFYDDRKSVLAQLRSANRVAREDQAPPPDDSN